MNFQERKGICIWHVRNTFSALGIVGQWSEHWPLHWRITGSIPNQGHVSGLEVPSPALLKVCGEGNWSRFLSNIDSFSLSPSLEKRNWWKESSSEKKKCFKKHDAIGGLKKTFHPPSLFGIGIYLSVYLPPYITLYHSNYIFFSWIDDVWK